VALISSQKLAFGDAESRVITSDARIEELAAEGFLFEACAAQSMAAEAMLSLVMLTAVLGRDDLSETRLGNRIAHAGFDRLIELEADYGVLGEVTTSDLLERYAGQRRFLVERHLPELHNFDYQEFLQAGREVGAALWAGLPERRTRSRPLYGRCPRLCG